MEFEDRHPKICHTQRGSRFAAERLGKGLGKAWERLGNGDGLTEDGRVNRSRMCEALGTGLLTWSPPQD
jgi:hypothetical protein